MHEVQFFGGWQERGRKLVFSGKAGNALFFLLFFGKKVVVAAAKKMGGSFKLGVLLFFFGAVITQMEGRPKRDKRRDRERPSLE